MSARRKAGLVAAAALLCAGCSGAPFRGGHAASDASIPGARVISSFVPGACQDASGAALEPDFTAVDVLQSNAGRLLLLERRNGYAPLVVENYFARNSALVFQVIVRSAGLVREWRVPGAPGARGLVQVGRQLTELRHGAGFEAGLASSRLRCTLVPKAPDLPASSTNPVP